MFKIKVYINNKLIKTIDGTDKDVIWDRFGQLSYNAEKYTFDLGVKTKVELYDENDKLIRCIETEY